MTPSKVTQQRNECSESNLWPQMGYGVHLLHRDLQLGAGSNPLPLPCSMPRATCPAPTCLPGSWSPPFFLLIRGLRDSTVPAILELSLISSAFRNNHHRKTLRAAGMQVGRTSTKQAFWQANVCHPFLPVPRGTRSCLLSFPEWGEQSVCSDTTHTQSFKAQLYFLYRVNLDKSLALPEPQFFHLYNGVSNLHLKVR